MRKKLGERCENYRVVGSAQPVAAGSGMPLHTNAEHCDEHYNKSQQARYKRAAEVIIITEPGVLQRMNMGDNRLQRCTHHLVGHSKGGENILHYASVGKHAQGLETLELHRCRGIVGIIDIVAESGFLVS